MAEHMLILGVESPKGEKHYVAAAFPSACGKTNFAMLIPPKHFEGWKITTIGDDIAWMRPGADGRLYAINPEAGYFGVVPGTNFKSNPNAMITMQKDTIYTNVALLPDGDVWWEGKDGEPPKECLDWKGNPWTPASKEKAAHPNSRFAAPMANNPALAPEANDPNGCADQRADLRRPPRHDPAARLPDVQLDPRRLRRCHDGLGNDRRRCRHGRPSPPRSDGDAAVLRLQHGRLLPHWLRMRKLLKRPPKVFHVNWFRKSKEGKFLWPGYGDNMRVLKWIIDRCKGIVPAYETPVGWMPESEDIDLTGLSDSEKALVPEALSLNVEEWKREVLLQDELFLKMYSDLPKELIFQRELLISRL